MSDTAYCLFETPLGSFGIAWRMDDDGRPAIVRLRLPEAMPERTAASLASNCGTTGTSEPPPEIAAVIEAIGKHLLGDAQDFQKVPLDLSGADAFARRVYEAARAIRSGETTTYGGLARAVNHPGAARAVGQALGRNPVALIIPCHRVLAAGGKLGGFSAHLGPTTKLRLLAIEGVTLG